MHPQVVNIALLSVVAYAGGCAGPVCDLDRGPIQAQVELTTPVSDYDATIETTREWLKPARAIDPRTGEELNALNLKSTTMDPVEIAVQCRDGIVVARDGEPDPYGFACGEGFIFAGGVLPAEVRVTLAIRGNETKFVEPPDGHTRIQIEPVLDQCGTKGFIGTIVVNTEADAASPL